jgi:hypothetical protein
MTAPAVVTDLFRDDSLIALAHIRRVEETAFQHPVGTPAHEAKLVVCEIARRFVNIFATNCDILQGIVPEEELYGKAAEQTTALIRAEHAANRRTAHGMFIAREGLAIAQRVQPLVRGTRQLHSFSAQNRKLR